MNCAKPFGFGLVFGLRRWGPVCM